MCRCRVKANWKIKYVIVVQVVLLAGILIGLFLLETELPGLDCSNREGCKTCNGAILIGIVVGSFFISFSMNVVWTYRVSIVTSCTYHLTTRRSILA